LNFPVTPEKFPQRGIVRLAWFPLNIFQVFGKPKSEYLQHSIEGIVRVANGYEGMRLVEVIPVLEIGCRF